MSQTVIGMFESSSKAQEAVQDLVDAGIKRDKIDVSSNSSYLSASETSGDDSGSSVSKFFRSLFGNNDDADKYTKVASGAQSIVTVHAGSGDEAERIADILDDNGAVDIDDHALKMGYGSNVNTTETAGTDYIAEVTTGNATGEIIEDITVDYSNKTGYTDANLTNDTTTGQTNKIPIIEESLAVGKRQVETGGIRVRSRIVERAVEESVRLREEHVNIERTAVDRVATAADFDNFKDRDVEMIERAEVPVVSKEARVVEEINLGKEVEQRSETISDTVRKTEVDVESLDKNDLKGNNY